jgi:hypothetical protein
MDLVLGIVLYRAVLHGWHPSAEACISVNTCYEVYFIALSISVGGDTDCGVLSLAPCSLVRGLTSMSDLELFLRP